MRKKIGGALALCADSVFLVLIVAALLLALDSSGGMPAGWGAVGRAYTANALPIANISAPRAAALGVAGALVAGSAFMAFALEGRAARP